MIKIVEIDNLLFQLNFDQSTCCLVGSNRVSGDVIIPISISYENKNYCVVSINSFAFKDNHSINSICIPDDSKIKNVSGNAFYNCSLKFFYIPESIENLNIGWCNYCKVLNFIQISPKNRYFIYLQEKVIIGKSDKRNKIFNIIVFVNRNLEEIFVPSFIKFIGPYSFSFSKIKKVDFSKNSNICKISQYAFANSTIESILIPMNVIKICKYAFFNCKKLENVIFEKDSKLCHINEYSFAESSIKSIILPIHIINIGRYAFYNCTKLQKVIFEEDSELQNIDQYAFSKSSFVSIEIPKNIKNIHNTAFDYCDKMKTIIYPHQLKFFYGKNVCFSKFKYLIKLEDTQYGEIFQMAGILSFLCYSLNSLNDVLKSLDLPNGCNLYKSFQSKFSTNLAHFFEYVKNFDIYSLEPSIGMMCAYRIIEQKIELNDLYLELLNKGNCWKFEFNFIKKHSDPGSSLHIFKNYCNFNGYKTLDIKKCKLSAEISKRAQKYPDFFNYVHELNDSYPELFKSIPLLNQLSVNNNLSLVFLCGRSFIEKPGIYSFHLHGTMTPCVRDFNTGFICFNDQSKDKFPENFEILLQYLLDNNPLYKDIEKINQDNVEFTRNLTSKVGATCAFVLEAENEIGKNPGSKKRSEGIYVGVTSKSDGTTVQMPFEIAIASLFPFLFPGGPIKEIPGKTLRQKVQNLLLSSEKYRCGPVAAHLILFCFDLIEKDDNYYFQNFVKPKQLVSVPGNYDRTIPVNAIIRKADPSFGLYWHIQLESINGYCEIFGNPDLMMTLTFGNNWPECKELINVIKSQYSEFNDSNFGMIYSGVESMFIFEDRLSKIKENKFEKLLSICNLPKCKHFVCRLEFQNRGAPHVHILMWLEERLSLSDIQNHFFACKAPIECKYIHSIVNSQMIHSCKYPRCFSGKDKSKCKYGFPKTISDETKYIDGNLFYKRNDEETNIVEYNPALLNEWGAHAHIHILRCSDADIPNSDDSCYYVLKYNMKSEPNVTVSVNNPDLTWKSLFQGRVVSLEEATARIFSFSFCQKDVITKYINIQLPDKRKANFDNWKQKNYDDIEAYFNRPQIVQQMSILDFYSLYDISYITQNNSNNSDSQYISKKGRINNLFYLIHKRTNKCIVTFPIFDYSTQREEFIYEYLILNNLFTEEPKIENGESYDKFLSDSDFHVLTNEIKSCDPYCFYYIKHLIDFQRYHIDKVIQKLTNLLSRGIPKRYINETMNSLLENVDDLQDQERIIKIEKNKRIKEIISSFEKFCEAFEIESGNSRYENNLRKYIQTDFDSSEIEFAKTEYETMSEMLNKEQKDCVDSIINDIESRTPVFISGKAGTGKSFVIKCLQNYFIMKDIKFVVTASTGIAAVLIGGKTIHSAFSIYSENENINSGLSITNAQGRAIAECDVVFVDEVTMASRSIFDLIDIKLKELKAQFYRNKDLLNTPFGGTMMILSGDLGQVPCVVKNADDMRQFQEMFNNMDSFKHFKLFPLITIMRRNEESDNFLSMLDNIRNYNEQNPLSDEVIDMIRSKFIEIKDNMDFYLKVFKYVGSNGMAIFYKNSSCDDYNNIILDNFAIENFQTVYSVRGQLLTIRKKSYLNGQTNDTILPPNNTDYKLYHAYLKRRDSQSLVPFCFKFCIGSRVILLKNIDTSNGLVNGRRGEIKEIIFNEISHLPEILIVHFDQISIFPEVDYDITFMKVDTFRKNNGSSFSFYQFPLKLCFAVTSHKCQGQTLDKVAICIDEPAFAHGSFYVAMSRVRCLDDIVFFGKKFPKKGPILHMNNYIADLNYKIDHKIYDDQI